MDKLVIISGLALSYVAEWLIDAILSIASINHSAIYDRTKPLIITNLSMINYS